ncbi:DUF6492 family protein [Polynucleobacter kasalickyi]|nr:DUF6492 family protein [Polynucleobacter kasalickyi]
MHTTPIVLYCCTFSKDLNRVKRLMHSIARHNLDKIPVYISAPSKDIELFKNELASFQYTLLNEETILNQNPLINQSFLYQQRGWIQQQIIKSEFWRLNVSDNYLVMDSDCIFIKDFTTLDFIAQDHIPYSIVHEGRDILQATERFGPKKAREGFLNDRLPIKEALGRSGPVVYDFGYAPFLWSNKVWQSLETNYLIPEKKNFLDIILECDSEFTWYGESLIKYQAIPIYPREQLFKHYHYEHQYWQDKSFGYSEDILKKDFLGIVYQSNWQTWEDFGKPQKKLSSRLLRSLKRQLKYLQFKLKTF